MDIKKGHLVCVKKGCSLFRWSTPEEQMEWRRNCEDPFLSDGETRLPPVMTYIRSDGETFFKVIQSGYRLSMFVNSKQNRGVEITEVETASGERLYALDSLFM